MIKMIRFIVFSLNKLNLFDLQHPILQKKETKFFGSVLHLIKIRSKLDMPYCDLKFPHFIIHIKNGENNYSHQVDLSKGGFLIFSSNLA